MKRERRQLVSDVQDLGSSARQLGHLLRATDWLMSQAPDPAEFELARYEDVAAGLVTIARGLTSDLLLRIDDLEAMVTTTRVVSGPEAPR